jgi:hypothetical protein
VYIYIGKKKDEERATEETSHLENAIAEPSETQNKAQLEREESDESNNNNKQ